MDQQTVTLIVAGLGIVGTLTRGPLTQYFARHSQHEQWELDKNTEEFRELLDALPVAYLEACETARRAIMREQETMKAMTSLNRPQQR
jgi:hypothetical protein